MILPTIGVYGFFTLKSPFDKKVGTNEKLTCRSIRTLSELLANNETPWETIYKANGVSEADYDADRAVDMQVVYLQSSKGTWLGVPAKYIESYPNSNGVQYRGVMIGVSLPPIEASRDLSAIKTEFSNIVIDTLGVTPTINMIETSGVALVDNTKHIQTQARRAQVSNGRSTDRARYTTLLVEHQQALDKIKQLEDYILNNNLLKTTP